MIGENVISILRRLLESAPGELSRSAAELVLQLRFPEEDQTRIDELATRSNDGKLTSDEAEEYDGYIAAADLLALWQSKARQSLKHQSSAA